MFTIKYRTYNPSPKQDGGTTCFYDQCELIDGPFALVSQEMDDGYIVVHAHRDHEAPGTMFGPVRADEAGKPRPTLWVMNEQGATVAKYDL